MKKPLAIMPAAKAGFENGSGLKFRQPRSAHSNGKQRNPFVTNETQEQADSQLLRNSGRAATLVRSAELFAR
ncbi:hypothetical protein [Bradyrhizobium sp. AS23.2]|uniref:hypothetical protein n=1 Tax=Bradyrhizobium sp. AS23.2 TaxID=1680155 RepID=UPI001160EE82|nr:hypothetical protein [Bradyrhizobium sp. AS23.2]